MRAPGASPLLDLDAGEHDDEPAELYALADLVHVACGGHAGDAASMERVVRACLASGTRVGSHPSYADRERFGRVTLDAPVDEVAREVFAQCRRLLAAADGLGASLVSMKLHGALYHDANGSPELARACVDAAARAMGRPAIVGPAHGALAAAAVAAGLPFLVEAFADRAVRADGTLVPRGEPGAVTTDPVVAAARARDLAADERVELVCVHADTEGALAVARAVREALGPKP